MCRALNTVSSVRKTEKGLGLEAQIEKPGLEVTRFQILSEGTPLT